MDEPVGVSRPDGRSAESFDFMDDWPEVQGDEPMTEQTPDALWQDARAEAMRRHDAGDLYALTKSRVTTFVEGALWGAAVVRASGAGLGGTSREQIAGTVAVVLSAYTVGGGRMPVDAQIVTSVTDAVLALRPNPAPDDTTDLRAQVGLHSQAEVALDLAERILAERDAARADLARAREEAKLRAYDDLIDRRDSPPESR